MHQSHTVAGIGEGWLSAMAGDGIEGSHLVERRIVAPGGCHERRLRVEPATLVLLPGTQMSEEPMG